VVLDEHRRSPENSRSALDDRDDTGIVEAIAVEPEDAGWRGSIATGSHASGGCVRLTVTTA
jgi:hypothetical protein